MQNVAHRSSRHFYQIVTAKDAGSIAIIGHERIVGLEVHQLRAQILGAPALVSTSVARADVEQETIGALVVGAVHIKVHPAAVILVEGFGTIAKLAETLLQILHGRQSAHLFSLAFLDGAEVVSMYSHVVTSAAAIAQIVIQSVAAVVIRCCAAAIDAGYKAKASEVSCAAHMELVNAQLATNIHRGVGHIHGGEAHIAINIKA